MRGRKSLQEYFYVTPEPARRNINFLGLRAQRDVCSANFITSDKILLQMMTDRYDSNEKICQQYWTLLDDQGKVLQVPAQLMQILESKNWSNARVINTSDLKVILILQCETEIQKEPEQEEKVSPLRWLCHCLYVFVRLT